MTLQKTRKTETAKQKKARLRKSAQARNTQRRERYAADPSYRKRAVDSTRQSYRRNKGTEASTTCLENLKNLGSFGQQRPVPGKSGRRVTLKVGELAAAMNRNKDVVDRWIKRGMFPKPGAGELYEFAEAKRLVRLMGTHQAETAYYRMDHSELRADLFAAMGEWTSE